MGNQRCWTDAERRQVGDWLLAGKSLGLIAKMIGSTKNVVVGRISRDGELHAFVGAVVVAKRLHTDPGTVARRKKRRPAQVPDVPQHGHPALLACVEVGPEAEHVEPLMPGEVPGRPLAELGPLECKWPVAEHPAVAGRHLFCGAPRRPEQPYCLRHMSRAH
jgi:hypothetical protein